MLYGAIIVDGKKFLLPNVTVRTWMETGLYFDPPNAPAREERARWTILHWTGSERSGFQGASQIHRSLDARRLSVEFAITNEGTVWQYMDPAVQRGKHCSRLNKFSVGIEVSNTGWLSSRKHLFGPVARRRQYEATIHGWRTTFFDFFPVQQASLNALCDALVESLGIEPRVICAPWERRPELSYAGDSSGFCGHLHGAWLRGQHPKCDPGTAPLEALKRHFAESRTG